MGFLDRGEGPAYEILPDYALPLVENEALAPMLAGGIGVLVVFAAAYGVAVLRQRLDRPSQEHQQP